MAGPVSETREAGEASRLCDDETAQRWMQKHLAAAPRLTDQQLREIGEILGLTLAPRPAKPA